MSVCHLLSPLLIEKLNTAGQGLDRLLEAARANNVLQVLQHALIMLRLTFRLHHGNLLHLTLYTDQNNNGQTQACNHSHKKQNKTEFKFLIYNAYHLQFLNLKNSTTLITAIQQTCNNAGLLHTQLGRDLYSVSIFF